MVTTPSRRCWMNRLPTVLLALLTLGCSGSDPLPPLSRGTHYSLACDPGEDRQGYFVSQFRRHDGSPWLAYVMPLVIDGRSIECSGGSEGESLRVNGEEYSPIANKMIVVYETDGIKHKSIVELSMLATMHQGDLESFQFDLDQLDEFLGGSR